MCHGKREIMTLPTDLTFSTDLSETENQKKVKLNYTYRKGVPATLVK